MRMFLTEGMFEIKSNAFLKLIYVFGLKGGKWKCFGKHENKISFGNKMTSGSQNANAISSKTRFYF